MKARYAAYHRSAVLRKEKSIVRFQGEVEFGALWQIFVGREEDYG